MVVELAFAHLGALSVSSEYVDGNEAPAAVSAKLGYLPDGTQLEAVRGEGQIVHRVRPTRKLWHTHRPEWLDELEVTGLGACLTMLGAGPV